jgi:hypothetical protein
MEVMQVLAMGTWGNALPMYVLKRTKGHVGAGGARARLAPSKAKGCSAFVYAATQSAATLAPPPGSACALLPTFRVVPGR